MSQPTRKAKVKATGKIIDVYKQTATGMWVDYSDCTTTYSESELDFQ